MFRYAREEMLVVNLAQVVTCDCAVCGDGCLTKPVGERLLLANVTETVCYLFCASCGDNIVSYVQSQSRETLRLGLGETA